MATAKFYDTDQIDARVPSPTGQTQGNVLTIGATGPEWAAPGGSGGTTRVTISSLSDFVSFLENANPGDEITFEQIASSDDTKWMKDGVITFLYNGPIDSYKFMCTANCTSVKDGSIQPVAKNKCVVTSTGNITFSYYYGTAAEGTMTPSTFTKVKGIHFTRSPS